MTAACLSCATQCGSLGGGQSQHAVLTECTTRYMRGFSVHHPSQQTPVLSKKTLCEAPHTRREQLPRAVVCSAQHTYTVHQGSKCSVPVANSGMCMTRYLTLVCNVDGQFCEVVAGGGADNKGLHIWIRDAVHIEREGAHSSAYHAVPAWHGTRNPAACSWLAEGIGV